jgi:hypothetical protein
MAFFVCIFILAALAPFRLCGFGKETWKKTRDVLYLACLGMESFMCMVKLQGAVLGNVAMNDGIRSLDLCKKPKDGSMEMSELRNKPLKQKLENFSVGRRRCPYLSKIYGGDFFITTGDYDKEGTTVNTVLHYIFNTFYVLCPRNIGKGRTWKDRDEFMSTLVVKMGYGNFGVMSRWDMQKTSSEAGILNFCTSGFGAMWLQKAPQGGFMIDMSFAEGWEMRKGFQPFGGTLYINNVGCKLSVGKLVLQGKEYKMGDEEFDAAMFVLRSSVFTLAIAGDHTMFCHMLVSNLVTMAARTTLKPSHPLRAFLNPFTIFSAVINDFAEYAIVDPGAVVGRLSGLSNRGQADMVRHYTQHFRYCETFPEELKRKGFDVQGEFGEKFIYAKEGLLLWGIFERFVHGYVLHCWADDAAVASDIGIAAFFTEISSLYPQITGCLGPPPNAVCSRVELEKFLTFHMWNVTAVHEHTGFVGDLLMEYDFAQVCLKKGDFRDKHSFMPSISDSLGVLFAHAITSSPSCMLTDPGLQNYFPEGPIRELCQTFRSELMSLHTDVVARNKTRAEKGVQPCWTFDPGMLEIAVTV